MMTTKMIELFENMNLDSINRDIKVNSQLPFEPSTGSTIFKHVREKATYVVVDVAGPVAYVVATQ